MNCPICNKKVHRLSSVDGELYYCPEHGEIKYFPDPWRNFRREASKAILQGMVANKVYRLFPEDVDWDAEKECQDRAAKRAAYTAVKYANALIDELEKTEDAISKKTVKLR